MEKQTDLKRSEFSSLDIFLFSNGQQHSPPRKYNLRADELNWWEATLNYLARSQYGSKHTSIELYTIDGQRVGGPRELCGDAAYVAVEPPDLFIQSGYDKYLIKASRSWEKRQERKGSNSVLTESDNNNPNNKVEIKDTTSIKIYQDITIVPTSSTIANEDVVVKTISDSKSKPNPSRPRIVSGKQVQKRKMCTPQQNPSILRKKYVNPVNPMTKKGATLSKETSKVNTIKKKTEPHIINTLENETSLLKSNHPGTTQIFERDVGSLDKSYNSSSQVAQEEFLGNEQPYKIVSDKLSENKIPQIQVNKSDSAEKDVLSRLYNNEEHHHQSIFINPKIPSINYDKKDGPLFEAFDTEHKVMINSTAANVCERSNYSQSYCEVHGVGGEINVTRVIDASETDKNVSVTGNGSQTADNFEIFVNHGETVNLTLNIEIKNVPGTASVDVQNMRTPSESKTTKPERDPQGKVDMVVGNGSLNRSFCEQAVLTSWQPLPTQIKKIEDQVQETINDMKITVCKCSCCSNSEKVIPFKAAPVCFDNNNYFILIPSEKVNGNLLGCSCTSETQNKNSILPITSDNADAALLSPKRIKDSVELLKDKLSISKTNSKIDQCPKYMIFSPSTFENDRQTRDVAAERCIAIRDPNVTDCKLTRPSTTNAPKVFNDASTQTDWTNLLLEARLHEDGRYSFHMPPLEMLKIYNAL